MNDDTGCIAGEIAHRLSRARHVMVFTGAGMSEESGIPTFRDAQTGLWANFDPEHLATPSAWRRNAPFVLGWYVWRAAQVRATQPHAGHRALARIAQRVPAFSLITQNVDDLHERAGNADVVHLHGRIDQLRCFACRRPGGAMTLAPDAERTQQRDIEPERCLHCGGKLRPDVVWFGEALPPDAWRAAETAARDCDLMLVIGTSLEVHPAALLPAIAQRHGAFVVEINPEAKTRVDGKRVSWRSTAATALPTLLSAETS
jgi:NAD-dependent deacetylase